MEAGEAEVEAPARKLVKWNEYEGRLFTIRVGALAMYEYADYAQDDNSKAAVRPGSGREVPGCPLPAQGAPQVLQAARDLDVRDHVRRPLRQLPGARNRHHGRGSRDPGSYLRRPHQGGLLAEQGHVRRRGLDHGAGADQRCDPSHPRRRRQVARLLTEGAPALEPRVLRRLAVGRTVVLHLRAPGGGPPRLGADRGRHRGQAPPPRAQRAPRQGQGRHDQDALAAGGVSGASTSSTPAISPPTDTKMLAGRGLLSARVRCCSARSTSGRRRRSGRRQSDVPWRERRHDVAGHRRDTGLQHAWRILQSRSRRSARSSMAGPGPGSS